MSFRLIDDCEIKALRAAVCEVGQRPEDFEIEEKITVPFVVEEGFAIVRNRKSGVVRSYPIGHETVFPGDFIRELEQGIFE